MATNNAEQPTKVVKVENAFDGKTKVQKDNLRSYDMKKAAEILKTQYGVNIGRNKLLKCLRDLGYLNYNNYPEQKFLDDGTFKVVVDKLSGYFTSKTLITENGIDTLALVIQKHQMQVKMGIK